MKGKARFTQSEIDRLRQLLREKVQADRSRQKRIRDEMRSMGFYITDHDLSFQGLTEADLDALLARGDIEVIP